MTKSKLIDELLGEKLGCTRGMGGSASISIAKKSICLVMMVLMGSNGPIGVGEHVLLQTTNNCISW